MGYKDMVLYSLTIFYKCMHMHLCTLHVCIMYDVIIAYTVYVVYYL